MSRSIESQSSESFAPPGYRLLERLGEGTYGVVHRARHERTGQDVALKFLRPAPGALLSIRRAARFRREMELCALMNHPHVVRLLDRGERDDGTPWAAFEFVEGRTLQELLRSEGPVPGELLKPLMCQILEALAYAHRKGVVHRDLKPANIMVSIDRDQAWAKVLDFGVGAFLEGALAGGEALTMTAETIGTPAYAAPEQLRGEPAGGRSDLYAWGLVFLECLLGRPVVTGASVPEIVHRQLQAEEIPLPQGVARHPVGALLRRVLAKRVDDRVADASQVLAEFRRIRMDDLVGFGSPPASVPGDDDRTVEGMMVRSEVRPLVLACVGFSYPEGAEDASGHERLDQVARARRTLALDIASRYGGWCAGSLGDFQLHYFGYPVPTGQEARLAALFALDLARENAARNEVESRSGLPAVEFRGGIHSGLVEVERGETPAGVAVTRALRLAFAAAPGTVLVGDSVRERMARHAEIDASLEGASQLRGMLPERADTEDASAPLVGRVAELAVLDGAWKAVRTGEGRVVVVRGEAGMGKSALIESACAGFRLDGGDVLQARCLPEQRNAALHPVLDLLRRGLGIGASDAPEAQVARWESALRESGIEGVESLAVLCQWLSLPAPSGAEAASALPPRRRKDILFGTLEGVLARSTGSSRAVVLEDLHWADPTTLEFLARLLPSWKGGLLLASCRTEFDIDVLGGATVVSLEGLSVSEASRLLERALGRGRVSPRVVRSLHERSGGSPLFLETLAQALARGVAGGTGTGGQVDELLAESVLKGVPSGLMDLLVVQVDSAGNAAETARLASVLGREWDDSLLEAASILDPASLRSDLTELVNAGILVRGEGTHAFRHALLRDAAYASMAPARRREHHERMVSILEGRSGDEVRPALARHCAGAEMFAKAVAQGEAVVADLLARSSLLEAVRLSLDVLGWMDRMGAEAPADSRLAVHNAMTQALMGVRGWADPTVKERIDLSRRLLEGTADSPHYGSVLCALMTYHYVSSNRKELACVAEELRRHAERMDDQDLQIAARMFLGLWSHGAGLFERAAGHFAFVLDNYDPVRHADHAGRFGLDSRVWTAATLALVEWYRDMPEQARRTADHAVASAREVGHVPSEGIALLYKANLCHYAADREALASTVAELLALAEKYGVPVFQAYGKIMSCWIDEDVAGAEQVISMLESMNATAALTYYRSIPAEVHARHGRWDEAIAGVEACLAMCEKNDEYYYQAPLLVLHGRWLLQAGGEGRERARASLEKAGRIARDHGLPLIEREVAAI